MANPIIPWVGGKRRLAKRLLPLFPEHQCYVEPFAGGAALFFMKAPSDVEVLNDINGKMIISVNDIPEMRQAFDGLAMESVGINYTVGGAKNVKAAKELIIRNW